jgi:hypothetical protein
VLAGLAVAAAPLQGVAYAIAGIPGAVAEVLGTLARVPDAFPDLALNLLVLAFRLGLRVAGGAADGFLCFAYALVDGALGLIFIHRAPPCAQED